MKLRNITVANIKKMLIYIIIIVYVFCFQVLTGLMQDNIKHVYKGASDAAVVLRNLDYQDVKNSGTWAKEAIYRAGALNIIKGYGNKRYGLQTNISKEQAIALCFRMAGREDEAQMAAEVLDNARLDRDKKNNPINMWSDGYLQLAVNEGLISMNDYLDSLDSRFGYLYEEAFKREAPAQRQEIAYWIAKVLNFKPVYEQQHIFNSFKDWKLSDPLKIPYIEAVLQKKIMNGLENGCFNPRKPLTREEAAQIVKNAGDWIFSSLGYKKKNGIIESIDEYKDYSKQIPLGIKTFKIRNNSGQYCSIITEKALYSQKVNEQSGSDQEPYEKELIVYKDGMTGNSALLEVGDRMEYVISDMSVKYINVVDNIPIRHIIGEIKGIDSENSVLNIINYGDLNNFDARKGYLDVLQNKEKGKDEVYIFAGDMDLNVNNFNSGQIAIITLEGNIVTDVRITNSDENNISNQVTGIVEENNYPLGYITLYREDGWGTLPKNGEQLFPDRTFKYNDPESINVYVDSRKSNIKDIEIGDTVFMKFDTQGNITDIRASKNYTIRYGVILKKGRENLIIKYDNGNQQFLDITDHVPVYSPEKRLNYNSLKNGDRVKLILNVNEMYTEIKEIYIQDTRYQITGLYKVLIHYIDNISDKIVVCNMEKLENERWKRIQQKGFYDIQLSEECEFYYDNKETDIESINNDLSRSNAYLAVRKDYGGIEKAVAVSLINNDDKEFIFHDTIDNIYPQRNELKLSNAFKNIRINSQSMVIKHERLVTAANVMLNDQVCIVANADYNTGNYSAEIVKIKDHSADKNLNVFRGRISDIESCINFTVESFSAFEAPVWKYYNTPKTFEITYDTEIFNNLGLINQRSFVDYGEESYSGKSVYIVSKGTEALLVTTAPFGTQYAKGEVFEVITDNDGSTKGYKLMNCAVYNDKHMWTNTENTVVTVLESSIILKNGKIITPEKIIKGDAVKIIGNDESDQAYLIFVNNDGG